MIAVFLDVETTGLDYKRDKLIEVGLIVVDLDQNKVVNSYEAIVKHEDLILENTTGHHINQISTEEMLKEGKKEELIAFEIEEILIEHAFFMHHGFFICQNPSFDFMFTRHLFACMKTSPRAWPYHWLDLASMYWVKIGHKSQFPVVLSKNNIARQLDIDSEAQPHRALGGALHLLDCYQEIMSRE